MVDKMVVDTKIVDEPTTIVENLPLIYQPIPLCEQQLSSVVKDLTLFSHQFPLCEEQPSTIHEVQPSIFVVTDEPQPVCIYENCVVFCY